MWFRAILWTRSAFYTLRHRFSLILLTYPAIVTGYGYRSLEQISLYNELALSPKVVQLAKTTAQTLLPLLKNQSFSKAQRIENAHVKEALVLDILSMDGQSAHSAILDGIKCIQRKGRWATHSDLNQLAGKFQVNLQVVGQINGSPMLNYPTITLNNEHNAHWTTTVKHLFDQQPRAVSIKQLTGQTAFLSPQPKELEKHHLKTEPVRETPEQNYKKHMDKLVSATNNQRFFNSLNKNPIDIYNLKHARAIGNESDLSFATRLQEAEIQRAWRN